MLWRQHQTAERTAASCAAVTADNAARDDRRPVTSGGPTAAVLGDSYAQGQHLDRPREQAWSTLLGQAEGWTTRVDAIGMTGFINGGYCGGQTFASRLPAVLASRPQVLVVEGGLNDYEADPADVRQAAAELLAAARAVPTVIVVGPPSAPARGDTPAAVDAALGEATAAAGRQYVSTLTAGLPYLPDRLHLTPEGHQIFADLVASAVR